MKSISIAVQWLVVLGLAGFMALVLWRPAPQPDYQPEEWRNWEGFHVLSYAGVARRDDPAYPSVKRLKEHLFALRDAGYRTLQPEDLATFLDERAPLPEKALLILFEGGRKEALIRATPVLQRTGFMAVMAVPTSVMEQWGGFYLKRGDLKRVARLPQWRIGSMGHRAIEPVPSGDAGTPGRFLSRRLPVNGQMESDHAFLLRIEEDFEQSARLLAQASGTPPWLYVYPFGDAGQGVTADPLAERANRAAVTAHYRLAFIETSAPFNGPGSDPWSLTRLRVPGNWTADQLLAALDADRARRVQNSIGHERDWRFERGGGRVGADGLYLDTGANAWLRGTDAWTDVEIEATLDFAAPGRVSLYARHTGPRSWVRAVTDRHGVQFQERTGHRLHTLFRHADPRDGAVRRTLRMRIRNNRAWLWIDNEPLASNLPLAPETLRGRVGWESDATPLNVPVFSARRLPARWGLANNIRHVPDDDRGPLQAILPVWFTAGTSPTVTPTQQQDLLTAAVAGIRTLPMVVGAGALDEAATRALALAIDAAVRDADLKALLPSLVLKGPAPWLAEALRTHGFRIHHLLSPAEALDQYRAIARSNDDEKIVVNASGPDADRAVREMLRLLPPRRLAIREPDAAAMSGLVATARMLDTDPEPDR